MGGKKAKGGAERTGNAMKKSRLKWVSLEVKA